MVINQVHKQFSCTLQALTAALATAKASQASRVVVVALSPIPSTGTAAPPCSSLSALEEQVTHGNAGIWDYQLGRVTCWWSQLVRYWHLDRPMFSMCLPCGQVIHEACDKVGGTMSQLAITVCPLRLHSLR